MDRIRQQLAAVLDWGDAHGDFDAAVKGLPVKLRGRVPKGLPYSPWQLVEHIRIAQEDILEFARSKNYRHRKWPDDYWPKKPAPPSARAWTACLAAIKRDRRALQRMVLDPKRDLLERAPTGEKHHTLLRGVLLTADHNAYHVGQLVAVRRALGAWPA